MLFIIVSVSSILLYKRMHNIFITNRESFTLHYNTGLLVIVVALSSGTGLSWSCDWDSQVLKVIVVLSSLVTNSLVTV